MYSADLLISSFTMYVFQGATEEAIATALAPAEDDPLPLTDEEGTERETLLDAGFKDWSRK